LLLSCDPDRGRIPADVCRLYNIALSSLHLV
jgi:hypothetical protein